MIKVDLRAPKRSKWWEYAIRFVFGGLVTVLAGLVGKVMGPSIGGLFLAFPSILPASLTLLASHKGRDKARADARGASVGSLGLLAFAGIVVFTARRFPPAVVLATALAAWLVTSIALWLALAARRGEELA